MAGVAQRAWKTDVDLFDKDWFVDRPAIRLLEVGKAFMLRTPICWLRVASQCAVIVIGPANDSSGREDGDSGFRGVKEESEVYGAAW